jgi:arginine N-succinyltransferase
VVRYEIRAALPDDEEPLLGLARHLDTVNLPNDREHVRRLLQQSERSFSGAEKPRFRKYVFLLWDLEQRRAAGTSMVVAQLGRRDAPYIYLDVIDEEKYHATLDKYFYHTVLRLGFSYQGPTEIGGLIVAPEYRAARERLGLLVSYVRFAYIAAHRDLFQGELLAELLPPLEPNGKSFVWEAFGRRFTGMDYSEADRLSSEDKTFIRDLFPRGDIYTSLFSPEAREVIGKVGPQTKGVEKMLRRIGFRYAHRIDPFDGGPHFVAPLDEVTLIRDTRRAPLTGFLEDGETGTTSLVAREHPGPPWFVAIAAPAAFSPGGVRIERQAGDHLGLAAGDEAIVLAVG